MARLSPGTYKGKKGMTRDKLLLRGKIRAKAEQIMTASEKKRRAAQKAVERLRGTRT